ncbi:MAG: hypothetical protein ACE5K4_10705 [Candidatus Hydrothermarchaeota archaeon]
MRGIILKHSIELFGFKDGFSFWFRWSFIDPIKQFIWLNITHKPYCTFCGWGCHEGCEHPKLTKKEDILKRWEEMDKESNKIIEGKDGKCVYCGIFSGRVLIPDPNGSLARWKVCETCKKIISAQQRFSMAVIMSEETTNEKLKTFWKNEAMRAQEEIDFLSDESFIPTFSLVIRKKDGSKN